MTKRTSASYSPEVRARAVRMVLEHQSDYPSQWAAMTSIASKIGCSAETLRKWVRRAERDQGLRDGQANPPGQLYAKQAGMEGLGLWSRGWRSGLGHRASPRFPSGLFGSHGIASVYARCESDGRELS